MVGAEGRLQLVPLGRPVPDNNNNNNKEASLVIRPSALPDPMVTAELPGEGPAGPGTGVQLQRRVVAYLLSGADGPGLQDVLHQVTVATDDVQGVHDGLPGLICGGKPV